MKFLVLAISLLCTLTTSAADFESVDKQISAEIQQFNQKLIQQRQEVFADRQKLRREIALAADKQRQQQADKESLKKQLAELKLEVAQMKKESAALGKTLSKAEKTSAELRRSLATQIPVVYGLSFDSKFAEQDKSLESKLLSQFITQYSKVNRDLLERGFSLNQQKVEAVNPSGEIEEMQLFALGHSVFFLQGENNSGFCQFEENELKPQLRPHPGTAEALEQLSQGQTASLPFDFTRGLAFKDSAKEKSLGAHLASGGFVVWPLLFLGLLCVLAGIYKTVQLYRVRSYYDDKVIKLVTLIKSGQQQEAQTYVDGLKDPVRSLLQEAFKHHLATRENLEEVLNESILSQLPKLDRLLSVLSVCAGAAPLMGLLGTVIGIIKTFEMIGIYGTGDASRLAGGISEALVTTEVGLCVAIPALIWHAILNRRLRTIVGSLEKAMLSFINAIKLEETSES